MTLAEQLKAEGIATGLQQGKLEGKLEVAERLLSEGIEIVFVSKMTGISLEQLKVFEEKAK